MNKSSRARIDQFIADSVAPSRLKGSEAMALRADKSIINLVDDVGGARQLAATGLRNRVPSYLLAVS